MKVDEWTSTDVHTPGGGELPPCAGLTSNALPERSKHCIRREFTNRVSTRNALLSTKTKQQKKEEIPHWYALRCTYGREKTAYDYMVAKGVTAFYPTTSVVKLNKKVNAKLLPNHVCQIFSSHTVLRKKSKPTFTTT